MAHRTGYLVGGLLLILLLGVPGVVFGLAGLTAACSNSPTAQAFLGVPSCSATLGVAAFGFILMVIGLTIGIVLLVKSRVPDAPTHTAFLPPPPSPPPTYSKVCLGCGTMFPTPAPKFCPNCGKPVPS